MEKLSFEIVTEGSHLYNRGLTTAVSWHLEHTLQFWVHQHVWSCFFPLEQKFVSSYQNFETVKWILKCNLQQNQNNICWYILILCICKITHLVSIFIWLFVRYAICLTTNQIWTILNHKFMKFYPQKNFYSYNISNDFTVQINKINPIINIKILSKNFT